MCERDQVCNNRSYFHRKLYEKTITSEVTDESGEGLRSQVFATMERNGFAVWFQTWNREEREWGSLQLVDFTFSKTEAIEKAVDIAKNAKERPFDVLKQM